MNIGIDLDETVLSFITPLTNYYNLCHGTNFRRDNYNDYRLWKTWGCSQNEANKFINQFMHSEHFFLIVPLPGVRKVLEKMADAHSLFIITARQDDQREKTTAYIHKYFGNLTTGVHYSRNSFSPDSSGKTKPEICDDLQIHAMIEDSLEYATDCLLKERKIFLIDSPWNRGRETNPAIERISSLADVLPYLSI